MKYFSGARGMTLIDVVVGTAIMLMVFLGLFAAFKLSIELVFSTKAKNGAVFLVSQKLEHIRLLPYSAVGTVGGIPAGSIPQEEVVSLNGIDYTIATLIVYVDDPADGLDENDETGITADYKKVKVEATWNVRGESRSTFSLTTISPVGIESVEGGGTLRVTVVDALSSPVSGATVRVVNSGASPAIDVSATSNSEGVLTFPGAPVEGAYEVYVSKSGYSSAQTYEATSENPSPSPGTVAVVEGQTTSMTFAIDLLSTLIVRTFSPEGDGEFLDSFSNENALSATENVEALSGALVLTNSEGVYQSSGTAQSTVISPQYLASWDQIEFAKTTPTDTAVLVRVYAWDGVSYTLIPDTDLSGNSTGFSESPIDISTLDAETYDAIALQATLTTGDTAVTPELLFWSASYRAGPTPLGSVDVSLRGNKTIGLSGGGVPIYKYDNSHTTNGSGVYQNSALEWDAYSLTLPAASPYAIVERCPNDTVVVPNSTLDTSLVVKTKTPHSLRVVVSDGASVVSDATVSLSGGGSDATSACGQAYFDSLGENAYTVSVSKSGFAPYNEVVSVSGQTTISIILTPQ